MTVRTLTIRVSALAVLTMTALACGDAARSTAPKPLPGLSASVAGAEAIDTKYFMVCTKVFGARYFHDANGWIPPYNELSLPSDAAPWCATIGVAPDDLAECAGRLNVIIGFTARGSRNPCLPDIV
jgi:hypothetical protein